VEVKEEEEDDEEEGSVTGGWIKLHKEELCDL
jgi:hypothetical protein